MALKEYAGGAAPTYLSATIDGAATAFTLNDATGWPTGATGPFWVMLSVGLPNEEKIKCSGRSGNNFTVASGGRGGDGTTAQTHTGGVTCIAEHVWTAEDARESNTHINDDTADDHSQYYNPTRHNDPVAHPLTALPMAAAGTDLADTIAGTDATLARGGHKHGFPAWTAYTPTWTAGGSGSIGNGSLSGRYLKIGKMGWFEFFLSGGSTTNFGSGTWAFSKPPGFVYPRLVWAEVVANQGGIILPGKAILLGSGDFNAKVQDNDPVNTQLVDVGATVPWTWVSGGSLYVYAYGLELS